ncbi:MAG: TonB-dependent receptor, partial [Phenylobacterium sp.]
MKSLILTTTAIAVFLPACASAQAAKPLDAVIVTATRLPSSLDWVTGAHVIDQAELEARQSAFALDVLATVPGVAIARNGAFGGLATIRIRGVGPDKTLVLVDSVPVGDAADPNGTFDPSQVQLSDISRIEVLSGPQGSLWGSEAIGGVVAFTTKELSGWRLEAEGGSFSTARGYAGAGVSTDAYAVGASAAGFRADGISKADGGSEADGFHTVTATAGGRVKLSGVLQLDGRVRYTDSKVDIDGFAPPTFQLGDTPDVNKSRAWTGFARATLDGVWGLRQQLSFSAYDLQRQNISSFPSRFDGKRQVWRWTAERAGLVVGAERNATSADLSGRPSLDLSTTSAFAVGRHAMGPLTVTGALRYDDPDRFKARGTGRLSAAWEVGSGFTATASAGQGFKVPTISQVICDFCFAPIVPLKPERAEGYDLRLGWKSPDDRFSAALTGYRLNVRDQIAYVASRYINIARTRSKGVEAEADVGLTEAFRLKLAYAVTEAVDGSTGLTLLRVPERSGAASLFWNQDPWNVSATLRAESSQADTARDGFSRTTRKGFAVADVA